ncbi:hypothetical protein CRBSH125_33570 [Afipia carboxidovorans]|nr:hypothetical protein CRBSH125_33570 [Afipia carboxidovorans]
MAIRVRGKSAWVYSQASICHSKPLTRRRADAGATLSPQAGRGADPGRFHMTAKPLASRIALVTGASRGIGHATARALARAGAHVIAVARTRGDSKNSTTKSAAKAAAPRWCRSTSPITTASPGSVPR